MKKTKAEKAAVVIVGKMYRMFVNPGKERGPNFDEATFNIEEFLGTMISLGYGIKKVPEKSMKKALIIGKAEWDRLIKSNGGSNAVKGQ